MITIQIKDLNYKCAQPVYKRTNKQVIQCWKANIRTE